MVVAGYRTGQTFAENYGTSRFQSICQNVKPQAGGWKPAVPAAFQEATPKSETNGSVSYNCETSAGPRIAIIYARTSAYGTAYGGGFWQADPVLKPVDHLGQCRPCSSDRATHARYALQKSRLGGISEPHAKSGRS
jgi:hypothetical protein